MENAIGIACFSNRFRCLVHKSTLIRPFPGSEKRKGTATGLTQAPGVCMVAGMPLFAAHSPTILFEEKIMAQQIIRYGIVGVKGFSQRHVLWINRAAAAGAPVRIAAVATIFDDADAKAAGAELARAGVKVVTSYADLLSLEN